MLYSLLQTWLWSAKLTVQPYGPPAGVREARAPFSVHTLDNSSLDKSEFPEYAAVVLARLSFSNFGYKPYLLNHSTVPTHPDGVNLDEIAQSAQSAQGSILLPESC